MDLDLIEFVALLLFTRWWGTVLFRELVLAEREEDIEHLQKLDEIQRQWDELDRIRKAAIDEQT